MAVRRGGLGKGLDSMFPVYARNDAQQEDTEQSEQTPKKSGTGRSSSSRKAGKDSENSTRSGKSKQSKSSKTSGTSDKNAAKSKSKTKSAAKTSSKTGSGTGTKAGAKAGTKSGAKTDVKPVDDQSVSMAAVDEPEMIDAVTTTEGPAEDAVMASGTGSATADQEADLVTEAGRIEQKAGSETEASDGEVMMVRLSKVQPSDDQPRKKFNDEPLEELADSIRQYGLIQPIVVRKKKSGYEIIAGERRWRAARMAGLTEVPVIVRELDDQKMMEISLIENLQREDLDPVEEARAYRRLMDEYELTQEEIAQRVSKNRATVANSLRLLKLGDVILKYLSDGQLSAGHARALLALEDEDLRNELAERIIKEKLSVRETESLVRRFQSVSGSRKRVRTAVQPISEAARLVYQEMEDKMKQSLGTRVALSPKTDQKGKIEIEYYSMDELERLYHLLRSVSE